MYIYIYIYIFINTFQEQTSQDFPSCLTPVTSLDHSHIFGKEVCLIVFRQKFYQNLVCGAQLELNLLIKNNVQLDYVLLL